MTGDRLEALRDLVWPVLVIPEAQRRAEEEKHQQELVNIETAVRNLPMSVDELEDHLGASERLLQDEASRRTGAESRLQSTAGLVSIAGTVVLGALMSLATSKDASMQPGAIAVLVGGCIYLAVQLVAALKAALGGLKSRGYLADHPHQVLPANGSTRAVFLKARIQATLQRAQDDRRLNSIKLDQLNVAHHATRNFLGGLLLLAVVTGYVALFAPSPDVPRCLPSAECNIKSPLATPSPTSSSPSNTPNAQPSPTTALGKELNIALIAIGTGICLVAVGFGFLLIEAPVGLRIAALLAAFVGAVSVKLGVERLEFTAFKFDKLLGELHLQWSTGGQGPLTSPTLLRKVVTVGPFRDGEHDLPAGSVAPCIDAALASFKKLPISGWIFVGRVDKRELTRERASHYGSNQALAMARANWVARQISSAHPSIDLTSAMVSVGGAQRTGLGVAVDDLKDDRGVDILAIFAQPPKM